jgi:carbon storage regulator CsrA
MLIVSLKKQNRLRIGGDFTLEVLEITPDRVRIGIVPPLGTPIDLGDEAAGDPNRPAQEDPEVTRSGDRPMLAISKGVEQTIVINETIRVRVEKIDRDKVRLGIEAPADTSVSEDELAGASPETSLPPEKLKRWVAERINTYLASKPRGELQKLAKDLHVSTVTVTRWRKGQTIIGREHLERLLRTLGVSRASTAASSSGDEGPEAEGAAASR